MNQANYVQTICERCFEETGESKPSSPVIVTTGSIRIRAYLCCECAAKAEDAEDAPVDIRCGDITSESAGNDPAPLRFLNKAEVASMDCPYPPEEGYDTRDQ